jgi:copper homeostasis protein
MKRFNTLNQQIIKEACTGSVQESIAAYEQGAQRVELCSRLDLDGLTPSI